MPAEPVDPGPAGIADVTAIDRCGCGRVAVVQCWLGDDWPARWLLSCAARRRASEAPAAA
jgi:hypothetical protein